MKSYSLESLLRIWLSWNDGWKCQICLPA